jgi:hypothetical protein
LKKASGTLFDGSGKTVIERPHHSNASIGRGVAPSADREAKRWDIFVLGMVDSLHVGGHIEIFEFKSMQVFCKVIQDDCLASMNPIRLGWIQTVRRAYPFHVGRALGVSWRIFEVWLSVEAASRKVWEGDD